MFLAVKEMMRSNWWGPKRRNGVMGDRLSSRLAVGSTIGFGFMPQAQLSARRLRIATAETYFFGSERFISYQLPYKDVSFGLIVASSDEGPYLAISRPLAQEEQVKLFGAESLEMIVEERVMKQLHCIDKPEHLKGWLANSYRKVMEGVAGRAVKGEFAEGEETPAEQRTFTYYLLVDEQGAHAIEIEQAQDGSLRLFATVYRPISDIGWIASAATPRNGAADANGAEKVEPLRRVPHPEKEMKAPLPPAPSFSLPPSPVDLDEEVAIAPPASLVLMAEETPSAPEPVALPAGNGALLPCDIRVASRIIDEALRNEMSLSELVRRVVELPLHVEEKVYLPLDFTEADYAALSVRYGMPGAEREAIKQRMLRELADFAGEEI